MENDKTDMQRKDLIRLIKKEYDCPDYESDTGPNIMKYMHEDQQIGLFIVWDELSKYNDEERIQIIVEAGILDENVKVFDSKEWLDYLSGPLLKSTMSNINKYGED